MHIGVIFDSVYGNTRQVATAIAEGLAHGNTVDTLTVTEARDADLSSFDLLIIGSPTRGFRPTPATSDFVAGLKPSITRAVKAAAFDTRIALADIHPAPLRWVVEAGGYAADRIQMLLSERGFALAGKGAGFEVSGTEGPLKAGELERAADWARALAA
jgi:flavodoxin